MFSGLPSEMIKYVTLFSLYVYDFCSKVSRRMYSMNLHKVMHSTQHSVRVHRATGGEVALLSVCALGECPHNKQYFHEETVSLSGT